MHSTKLLHAVEANLNLRNARTWKLLAANHGPVVLALLSSLFAEEVKTLPGSALLERLTRGLEALRSHGHALPQEPAHYLADWLDHGWVLRRLPVGAAEEVYELSAETAVALRMVATLHRPRGGVTESRLTSVMSQVVRLVEETDPNPTTRLERLEAERARIEEEIQALQTTGVNVLSEQRALELAREVVSLAEDLPTDFRLTRNGIDRLHLELRQNLLEVEGNRGDVLSQVFAGYDVIGESDAGRSFNAFWKLLMDFERSFELSAALDLVLSRPFSKLLEPRERRFLQTLTATLLSEGGEVMDAIHQFAQSLKSFVQSREFREERRLQVLLRQAQHAALAVRDQVRANESVDFTLTMSTGVIRSVAQWELHDPSITAPDGEMAEAPPAEIDLDAMATKLRDAEIDYQGLRTAVRSALARTSQASVSDVLRGHPATQGLASIVGLLSLAHKHGEQTPNTELVTWTAGGQQRSARIPLVYFLKERFVELLD